MTVRAVAVGIPPRLKEQLTAVNGVVVTDDLVNAASVLGDHPGAAVLYGEDLFGPAVTGQPVFLVDGDGPTRRVMLIIDIDPRQTGALEWDDPRKLVMHAGVRLNAGSLVDVSHPDALDSLDVRLDMLAVDTPRDGGYPEVTGNDENGDPNA